MFKEIKKHMNEHVPNPAKEFKPSAEDKFPNLTEQYWANPNESKGTIERCSYHSGLKEKSMHKEGL